MLRFYSDTKIYMHCPAGVVTGGAELLHQLVGFLRDNNRDAFIVYFGKKEDCVVPNDYCHYNISIATEIQDTNHNIEIFYEGIFERINYNKNTQKFLWWISVDNFFYCAYPYLSLQDLFRWNKKMYVKKVKDNLYSILHGHNPFLSKVLKIKELVDQKIPCGYQAEYIQHFLLSCGFKELYPLKDYINTEHCFSFSKKNRDNIIIYNPKKGLSFTKKLIAASPDLCWLPLQGMSRTELIATIRRSKLYVDFGFHPGKDRLPRECAMNGCCIITGKKGSAGFFEDVSLPDQYKFEEKVDIIPQIIDSIRFVLANYETIVDDFSYYRHNIMLEKTEFEQQIKNLFQLY